MSALSRCDLLRFPTAQHSLTCACRLSQNPLLMAHIALIWPGTTVSLRKHWFLSQGEIENVLLFPAAVWVRYCIAISN